MMQTIKTQGTRRMVRRPCLAKQLVRRIDTAVTRAQEWLEGEDKLTSKVVGYGVVAVTFLYMVGQVVRWSI